MFRGYKDGKMAWKRLIVPGTNQLKDFAGLATIILVTGKHKANKKIRNFSVSWRINATQIKWLRCYCKEIKKSIKSCFNIISLAENGISCFNIISVAETGVSCFFFSKLQVSWKLYLLDGSIFESCIEIKIKLNFYYHTSLWCLKRF